MSSRQEDRGQKDKDKPGHLAFLLSSCPGASCLILVWLWLRHSKPLERVVAAFLLCGLKSALLTRDMPTPVKLPDLGTAARAIRLSAWFVEPGDRVDAGDRLLEVLISGVTCDVTAPVAGVVTRLEVDIDQRV